MVETVVLLCPIGAAEYPISYGAEQYYAYRASIEGGDWQDMGGPWHVRVPVYAAPYFLSNSAGFTLMEEPQKLRVAGMIRLRKIDGSDATCGARGIRYDPDPDGTVLVHHAIAGELVESHGFEIAPAETQPPVPEATEDEEEDEEEVEEEDEEDQEEVPHPSRPGSTRPPRRG